MRFVRRPFRRVAELYRTLVSTGKPLVIRRGPEARGGPSPSVGEAQEPRPDSAAINTAAWAVLFHKFLCYPWPGNVRQLGNFAQQVILASDQSPNLPDTLRAALASTGDAAPVVSGQLPRRRMQDISDERFDEAMASNGCEVQRVARHLGVSRAAVYRRIAESPRYRLASELDLDDDEALALRLSWRIHPALMVRLRRWAPEPVGPVPPGITVTLYGVPVTVDESLPDGHAELHMLAATYTPLGFHAEP